LRIPTRSRSAAGTETPEPRARRLTHLRLPPLHRARVAPTLPLRRQTGLARTLPRASPHPAETPPRAERVPEVFAGSNRLRRLTCTQTTCSGPVCPSAGTPSAAGAAVGPRLHGEPLTCGQPRLTPD
jgi:hypothetical protein